LRGGEKEHKGEKRRNFQNSKRQTENPTAITRCESVHNFKTLTKNLTYSPKNYERSQRVPTEFKRDCQTGRIVPQISNEIHPKRKNACMEETGVL
jgi:hypothetical protein